MYIIPKLISDLVYYLRKKDKKKGRLLHKASLKKKANNVKVETSVTI
jgi:hypothetical protein